MTAQQDLPRSIAGHGLPGAVGTWPEEPLCPSDWAGLLRAVRAQRLSGLLAEALTAGTLPATEQQRAEASRLHFDRLCGVLMLESAALRVLDVLATAGVEAKVLKGSAVAHLDYPDPALRTFADVDLLVRSDDIDAAIAALQRQGHVRASVEPRAGFDRRFGKGATFTTATGHEIDLHRTFVMGPFGLRLRLDDLWARSTTFPLADRRVGALDAECRFLHACYHSALGDPVPRLVPLRDVAQMLLFGDLDRTRVEHLMRSWQAEAVVARAVRLSWETLHIADMTALSTWAQRYVPSPREARDVAVYVREGERSYAAQSVAALAALPSIRERAALAVALALPRRGFVVSAGSLTSRWRRAVLHAARLARSGRT